MANCNAGGNVDEGAKFKEYPAPTDKKNWFRFFSGCIDKMLDGIHKNTGTKISVSCYRRERVGCLCAITCVVLQLLYLRGLCSLCCTIPCLHTGVKK